MPNEPVVYTISSLRIQANIFPDSHFAIFCEMGALSIPIMDDVFLDLLYMQQNTVSAVKIDSLYKAVNSHFLKPACICQPGFLICPAVS